MKMLMVDTLPVPQQLGALGGGHGPAIALRFGDQELSYESLVRRADSFAAYLVDLGLRRGDTVAICLDRSFDWIVASLATMRAGAAYVPLDPAWPEERLRFAIQDSGASFLLARTEMATRLRTGVKAIDPFRDASLIASTPSVGAAAEIDPDSLAYVIYTSGSTGVPKGVEITHANLSNLVTWHCQAFSVTPQDRVSHLAGLGFDAAAWEIWGNLCAGATLCLASDDIRSSPDLIQQWILRERISLSFVPTVHARPLMAMPWPAQTSLRLLLTGGDALLAGPAEGLPFQVVNNYGPTEATVVATSSILQSGSTATPPIGDAITGARVYLLDEHRNVVPEGSIGEIYIGGRGVGRGYRNQPEQTAASFLADPFASDPGARMYRTGDLAVRLSSGELEFRGRRDRQAKIRGFRVELDEIGSVLERHPAIKFATATIRKDQNGENQIVAFALTHPGSPEPSANDLQEHLLQSLPDYMVPATFVRLSSIPISANGKIDLSLLPSQLEPRILPRVHASSDAGAGPADASPIEAQLLIIMRRLLDNQQISAKDNFFLAGGHSLLGMQLVMQLTNAFGVELTLRQLFEAPTVEKLAALIDNVLNEKRLAAIWAELLGRDRIGPDDNFFELGGKAELLASVQRRIAGEFEKQVPIDQLLSHPTVRRQTELIRNSIEAPHSLPPGLLALQPKGTRPSIFWIHYFSVNLARVVGDDQPFIVARLTTEDLQQLCEASDGRPTLQRIAACLVRKITTAQRQGPYTVGGLCLGGILAFEIASQLRAEGHEVALVVMLDPPSPSYLSAPEKLKPRWYQPRYLARRAARLGVRKSLDSLMQYAFKPHHATQPKAPKNEVEIAQELIELASTTYQPLAYDGKVLLLLASDRPPHLNFLPEWQALVPHSLYEMTLDGHHTDMTKEHNVQVIADAISSHLQHSSQPEFA